MKRMLALVLALIMVLSILPASALAEQGGEQIGSDPAQTEPYQQPAEGSGSDPSEASESVEPSSDPDAPEEPTTPINTEPENTEPENTEPENTEPETPEEQPAAETETPEAAPEAEAPKTLPEQIALLGEAGGELTYADDVTLDADLTVPANVALTLSGKVTVPAGVKLVNLGSLVLSGETELFGTLINEKDATAAVAENATLTVRKAAEPADTGETGTLQNAGVFSVAGTLTVEEGAAFGEDNTPLVLLDGGSITGTALYAAPEEEIIEEERTQYGDGEPFAVGSANMYAALGGASDSITVNAPNATDVITYEILSGQTAIFSVQSFEKLDGSDTLWNFIITSGTSTDSIGTATVRFTLNGDAMNYLDVTVNITPNFSLPFQIQVGRGQSISINDYMYPANLPITVANSNPSVLSASAGACTAAGTPIRLTGINTGFAQLLITVPLDATHNYTTYVGVIVLSDKVATAMDFCTGDNTEYRVAVNTTTMFALAVTPGDAVADVVWSVSTDFGENYGASGDATIDSDGTFRANSAGNVIVSAYATESAGPDGNGILTQHLIKIYGQFDYTIENGMATIVGPGTMTIGAVLEIPATVDGYPVVAIGDNAFKGNDDFTTLILPNGVRTIGNGAFENCEITSSPYFDMPASVTSIGENAFLGCSADFIFHGAPPTASRQSISEASFNSDAKIYYHGGYAGWSTDWNDYTCINLDDREISIVYPNYTLHDDESTSLWVVVTPSDLPYEIYWQVENGADSEQAGAARISQSGVLTGISAGSVRVWASLGKYENAPSACQTFVIAPPAYQEVTTYAELVRALQRKTININIAGNITLADDLSVPSETCLNIASSGKLTIPAGKTLLMRGSSTLPYGMEFYGGALQVNGTLTSNRDIYASAGNVTVGRGGLISLSNASMSTGCVMTVDAGGTVTLLDSSLGFEASANVTYKGTLNLQGTSDLNLWGAHAVTFSGAYVAISSFGSSALRLNASSLTFDSAVSAAKIAGGTSLILSDGSTLNASKTVRERFYIENIVDVDDFASLKRAIEVDHATFVGINQDISIPSGETLTVPQGAGVGIASSDTLTVKDGGTLTLNGYISASGAFIVESGAIVNGSSANSCIMAAGEGTITIEDAAATGSAAFASMSGYAGLLSFANDDYQLLPEAGRVPSDNVRIRVMITEDGWTQSNIASVMGYADEINIITHSAGENTPYWELPDSITVLDGQTLTVTNTNLRIPSDKTITANNGGKLHISDNADVLVEGGFVLKDGSETTVSRSDESTYGKLKFDGADASLNMFLSSKLIIGENGVVEITDAVSDDNINNMEGAYGGIILYEGNGRLLASDRIRAYLNGYRDVTVTTAAALKEALAVGSLYDNVYVDANISLTEDLTIPKNKSVFVINSRTLTIPRGKTLTVAGEGETHGSLAIETGSTLTLGGTLVNRGTLRAARGKINVSYGGVLNVLAGSFFEMSDVLPFSSTPRASTLTVASGGVWNHAGYAAIYGNDVVSTATVNGTLKISGGNVEVYGFGALTLGTGATLSGEEDWGRINVSSSHRRPPAPNPVQAGALNINISAASRVTYKGSVEVAGGDFFCSSAAINQLNVIDEAHALGRSDFLTALNSGYRSIIIDGNVLLDTDDSITIPADTTVTVSSGVTLNIPSSTTLTVDGALYLSGGVLNIYGGTVNVSENGVINALESDSAVKVSGTGKLNLEGTLDVGDGGALNLASAATEAVEFGEYAAIVINTNGSIVMPSGSVDPFKYPSSVNPNDVFFFLLIETGGVFYTSLDDSLKDYAVYYVSSEAGFAAAMADSTISDVMIAHETFVELTGDRTVPDGKTLAIPYNSGLQNSAELTFSDGAKLEVYGTLTNADRIVSNTSDILIRQDGHLDNLEAGIMLFHYGFTGETNAVLTNSGMLALDGDVDFGGYWENRGQTTFNTAVTVTLDSTAYFENYGTLDVSADGDTLNVNGVLFNKAGGSVKLRGNGLLIGDSTANPPKNGSFTNDGRIQLVNWPAGSPWIRLNCGSMRGSGVFVQDSQEPIPYFSDAIMVQHAYATLFDFGNFASAMIDSDDATDLPNLLNEISGSNCAKTRIAMKWNGTQRLSESVTIPANCTLDFLADENNVPVLELGNATNDPTLPPVTLTNFGTIYVSYDYDSGEAATLHVLNTGRIVNNGEVGVGGTLHLASSANYLGATASTWGSGTIVIDDFSDKEYRVVIVPPTLYNAGDDLAVVLPAQGRAENLIPLTAEVWLHDTNDDNDYSNDTLLTGQTVFWERNDPTSTSEATVEANGFLRVPKSDTFYSFAVSASVIQPDGTPATDTMTFDYAEAFVNDADSTTVKHLSVKETFTPEVSLKFDDADDIRPITDFVDAADYTVSYALDNTALSRAITDKNGTLTAGSVTADTSVKLLPTLKIKDFGFEGQLPQLLLCIHPNISKVDILNGVDNDIVTGKTLSIDYNESSGYYFNAATLPVRDETTDPAPYTYTWAMDATSVRYGYAELMDTGDPSQTCITANAAGAGKTVTLSCTVTDRGNVKKTVNVRLYVRALVTAVTVSEPSDTNTMIANGKLQLTATTAPEEPTIKGVTWSLGEGEGAFASVSATGLVTAKAVTADTKIRVTATAKDGSDVSSTPYEITIKPRAAKLTMFWGYDDTAVEDPASLQKTFYLADGSSFFTEYYFDAACAPNNGEPVQWTIAPATTALTTESAATAGHPDRIKVALGDTGIFGSFRLTAKTTDGSNLSETVTINVVDPVTSVTFKKNGVPIENPGDVIEANPGDVLRFSTSDIVPAASTDKTFRYELLFNGYVSPMTNIDAYGTLTIGKNVFTEGTFNVLAMTNTALFSVCTIHVNPLTDARLVLGTDRDGEIVNKQTVMKSVNGGAFALSLWNEAGDPVTPTRWSAGNYYISVEPDSANLNCVTLTPQRAGTLTLTAYNGYTALATCTVKAVNPVDHITMTATGVVADTNEVLHTADEQNVQFTAKAFDVNDKTPTVGAVQWSIGTWSGDSDHPTLHPLEQPYLPAGYTISTSGRLTVPQTQSVQNVYVRATATDGSGKSEIKLMMVHPAATSLSVLACVGGDDVNITGVPQTLAVHGTPASSENPADQLLLSAALASVGGDDVYGAVSWTLSSLNVASLTTDGTFSGVKTITTSDPVYLTANAAGTVTLTVTTLDGSRKTASIRITVVHEATSDTMYLTKRGETQADAVNKTLLSVTGGQSLTLTPLYLSSFGEGDYRAYKPTNTKLVWSFSNNVGDDVQPPAGVTLSQSGALSVGPITDTVNDLYVKATCANGAFTTRQIQLVPAVGAAQIWRIGAFDNDLVGQTMYCDMNDPSVSAFTFATQVQPVEAPQQIVRVTSSNVRAVTAQIDPDNDTKFILTLPTPRVKGVSTITVEFAGGKKFTFRFDVGNPASELYLYGPEMIGVGKYAQFTADVIGTIHGDVYYAPSNKTVKWAITSGGEYAAISTTGRVTVKNIPAADGKSVTVRATAVGCADPSRASMEWTLQITSAVAKSIALYSGAKLPARGTIDMTWYPSLQLTATVEPWTASQWVQWTSSNTRIADVDYNGLVTFHNKGSVTITAISQDGSNVRTTYALTVTAAVESLNIDGPSCVAVGKTVRLTTQTSPSFANNQAVTWELDSSSDGIATITSAGVLKGISQGTAYVHAISKDYTNADAWYQVEVVPLTTALSIYLEDEEVTGRTITVDRRVSPTLDVVQVVEPRDASYLVTWQSSNARVATVEQGGLITFVGNGNTTITIASTDGSYKRASFTLNVVNSAETLEIVNGSAAAVLAVGRSLTLKPVFTPADTTNKKVIWEVVPNGGFATITAYGSITGKTAGDVKVVATDAWGNRAEMDLTIYTPITAVNLFRGSEKVTNKTITLTTSSFVRLDANPTPLFGTYDAFAFTTSNANIATVTADGLVEFSRTGTVYITATALDGSGRTARCTVVKR